MEEKFKIGKSNGATEARTKANDIFHGVKLKDILEYLVEKYEWEGLADRVDLNCFKTRPTMKSSLRFIRKTPWAIDLVEELYLESILEDRANEDSPE